MRSYRWVLLALALVLGLAVFPARAQETSPQNNIVVVDPEEAEPPADLLDAEEIARIERLQTETQYAAPSSPVSPADSAVLIATLDGFAFLDINDGSSTVIPGELFEAFLPLPLIGITEFSWADDRTLTSLAINGLATTPEEVIVVLGIDRVSLDISLTPVVFPADTGLVTASPDFRHYLLVALPGEEEGAPPAEARSVNVSRTPPGYRSPERPQLPAAVQRAITPIARRHAAVLDRLRLFQEDGDPATLELTPRTLDLLLFDAAEGRSRYITTVPEASILGGYAWTRDSGQLAISLLGLPDPDANRPFYDGALVSEEIYRDVTGNLPPGLNPWVQNNNTYVISSADGATRLLRPDAAPNAPLLTADAWSPDGRTLLVKEWHPARLRGRTHPIYTPQFTDRAAYRFYDAELNRIGGFSSNLFSGGSSSEATAVFATNDELIFRGYEGSNRHAYYYNRVSGELRNLADRAGTYGAIVATNRSRQFVFVLQSFTSPPDIYRMNLGGGGLSRLTWLNEELRLEANIREYPVSFRLGNGQVRVGTLIQPADAPFPPRNSDIVVWQEGGPSVAMTNAWYTNVENPTTLLPVMGVPVLVTPLAGRPGYTPAVFNSQFDGANFGQIDIDEQAEIVRQMIARGWTSQGRVGISGCSYGGYFVLQSLVRHPDLYAAGNPQCAFIDLFTEWSRGFDRLAPYMMGLPPYNLLAQYQADSPVYQADRIRSAVLTFHGTEDFLPIVQNENLHLRLFNRGLEARMVKFIGEGHGLGDPANQLYAAQEQLVWFRTHLR